MIIFCFVLIIICIAEGVIIWNLAKDKNETIKNKIEFFREFWGKFVIYVLSTSVIGLFLGSIYFKDEKWKRRQEKISGCLFFLPKTTNRGDATWPGRQIKE